MTAKEVQTLRRALGWTQQELANHIGAQRESVARWEIGANSPRGANLKALTELKKQTGRATWRKSSK
jgi:DNA-binding transcriptional regulator YiaG